jgi:hypothetical protein
MTKLLLHVCCAPCAAYLSVERLKPRYDLTWYFYNPNLSSAAEFEKRLTAVKFVAEKFAIPLIVEPYDHAAWQKKVRGLEMEPERGKRCFVCYRDRLEKTVALAKEKGFKLFSTSLLTSPYKDTAAIRTLGQELAMQNGLEFLPDDFQADNGYQKSQALAKELDIYRQKFCGCEYAFGQQLWT